MTRTLKELLSVALLFALSPLAAVAQSSAAPGQAQTRITLPTVVVTAQKEPADRQTLPISDTAVAAETLTNAGVEAVSDAAFYAPNTYFQELTARKISSPRFRGIGASPANPGITTFIDGVPQLNANSSNVEFIDVDQVEFVRGPQSALFGRNTLGGLVNITSGRPSSSVWKGTLAVPIGNASSREVRAGVSGPLGERVAVGFALGRSTRDGFTVNDLTGRTLDDRSATFGKAQLLWTPAANWEARAIFSGERARDGDYALNDLGELRRNPFHVKRDFEGFTNRDIVSTTVLTRREGGRLAFSTTTGFVRWTTHDLTDLDYTPLPLFTRNNQEEDAQFTQEVRLASAANAPIRLGDAAVLKWQSGVFFFAQNYDQDAVNNFSPFVLDPRIPFPVSQHSPQSALDDRGIGAFGQGTVTVRQNLDVTLGARLDYESKDGNLDTFYAPAIGPPAHVDVTRSFSNISPQAALAYRFAPERMMYASVGRGFMAGGFNPASPAGYEAYGEEHTWNVEGGIKTSWAGGRVSANAAVFYIDWNDLQLNLPNLNVPGQFYIANVGGARSSGAELEVNARPHPAIDLFASAGLTHARFGAGSISSGLDVSDNRLPGTPDYTASLGAQLSRALRAAATLYGRAEAVFYGAFKYDDANIAGQDAYALTNFRTGVRGKNLFGEAWVKNAFDTRYVPIAFAYGSLAPSGYIGEMGRPRTFGVSGGITF
jgi:iron complex outermembrane receptor protein